MFPHQITFENATFGELTGIMSEPLTPQDAFVSQNSTASLAKLDSHFENSPLNGAVAPKTSLNGKATPLELSQHPIGELSLSQHPIGELSLSQLPYGDATLSGHYRGNRSQSRNIYNDLSLSQHPIADMSLSQYPIADMSLSQHPIADMSLSQHPYGEATLSSHRHTKPSQVSGDVSLSQHALGETPRMEQLSVDASLSQYLLTGVSGVTEHSPSEAHNAAVNGQITTHLPIADDESDSLVQHMTSGYSSVATGSSQNSTGLCCPDDDVASLKLDTMSFDHDELPRVNGKDWSGEKFVISAEVTGDAATYQCAASLDGIPRKRTEEFCKPSKGESEGSLFDSGRSESSMSSQSQASVVGVQHDHKVAIAGNLWSEENGVDTMLDTPRDDAGVAAIQRSRYPVCTSTPSSENDSGGSLENIPQPKLLKDQAKKRSLDSLVGHQGPDSGCASLAPSTVASQSYAPSTEALNEQVVGNPYMSIGDRERLLGTEIANEEDAIGGFVADDINETVTSQVVGDSTLTSSQAMTIYEEELIRTANELGICTGPQATMFHSATVDGIIINTGAHNVTASLGSNTGCDVSSAGLTTDPDLTGHKVLQNGVSRHETYEELLTSHPSLSQSIGASSVHSRLSSGEAQLSSSSAGLEMERPLDAGMHIRDANSSGTAVPFGSHVVDHQPVDATPTEKDGDNRLTLIPFEQSQDNLAVHDTLSQSTTDAILCLPDSGISAETSSTTSGSTACSVDKDVERIANEYFAILNGGARTNGGVSEKIVSQQDGRNNKFGTEAAVSQYSDSSATTYNELPRLVDTAAKIAGSHTLVVVTETGSVDGSVHGSSDTEDALDRDVRRILAKYGRTLSDDEDATSTKKIRAPPMSDSDDASSLSRRVNNLLNSGRGTASSSVVQPLYLYDDPARSMSIPTGSSSSINSTVPSLNQAVAVRTSHDGFRDGARTPSPQSVQSSDSLAQRVQNLLVGPGGQVVAVGNGRRSSMSSQSSVIDYTNLERELDEIQSSLASITSAEGLRSRHGSVSSQVSENAKLGHALTNLASNYAFDNDLRATGNGYAAAVGPEAIAPEGSDKLHKFHVNPMLTSGLVPVDVALDIMHGTAAFADDRSTGTIPSHRSAIDVGASEERTNVGDAYGRDRNNSNAAARDASTYSSDGDGDSVRLLGNDRVQDVSQLVAEILERGSPPRQAYKYLHEAEQHERSLESRRSLGDRSAEGNVLTQANVSGARATSAVNTTADSFNMSLPSYTPLNAFGTAHSLFSTQLLQFGSESVSPKRRHPENVSPSVSQKIAPGYADGERRDEKTPLDLERTQASTQHSSGRVDLTGHAHQQSQFRSASFILLFIISSLLSIIEKENLFYIFNAA